MPYLNLIKDYIDIFVRQQLLLNIENLPYTEIINIQVLLPTLGMG